MTSTVMDIALHDVVIYIKLATDLFYVHSSTAVARVATKLLDRW